MKTILFILLPLATFAQNLVSVPVSNEREAMALANAHAAKVGKVAPECRQVFRVPGTGSMLPVLFKNNVCVVEPVRFEDVREGDVAVIRANWTAADIAKGRHNGLVMHPVTGRTAERIFTQGMDSIRNPHPDPEPPTDRAHFIGVIRIFYHWN